MEETNTQIAWPSKLKIGAKSKKGKNIVMGYNYLNPFLWQSKQKSSPVGTYILMSST